MRDDNAWSVIGRVHIQNDPWHGCVVLCFIVVSSSLLHWWWIRTSPAVGRPYDWNSNNIFYFFFTQINGPSIMDFIKSGAPSFSVEQEDSGIRAQFTFTATKTLLPKSLIINKGTFATYPLPAPGPNSDAFWGPIPVPSLTPTVYDTCSMASHRWAYAVHPNLLGANELNYLPADGLHVTLTHLLSCSLRFVSLDVHRFMWFIYPCPSGPLFPQH